MSVRSNCWSVTINNPNRSDEENIAQARQKGWKVYGQLEKGESGTPHYQLMIRTPQVRFSALKKAFPRAHIEVSRNPAALEAYVQKDETRQAPLSVSQDKYPTQSQVYRWFAFYYRDIKKDKPSATNLEIFDVMCAQKIRQGFYIDANVMNPQIRAFIKKFGVHVAHRELASADRQTDRQADLFSQGQSITPNARPSSPSSLQAQEDDEGSSPSEYASETE